MCFYFPEHTKAAGTDMYHTTDKKQDWYCYLLQCADNTLYTGITNDLDKRIAAHNQGTASKYTRSRLPVQLVYAEPHHNRSSASKREAQIKKLSRDKKIALMTHLDTPA